MKSVKIVSAIAENIRGCDSVIMTTKKIPQAKGLPVFGTIFSIMAAGGAPKLHLYIDKRHKELGPIYREKIGPVSGVFISDGDYMRKIYSLEGKYPKHIIPEAWMIYNETYNCKRGLLFMEGEEWSHFRKILNNIILKPKTDDLQSAINFVAQDLVDKWHKDGKIVNLERQLYNWSLEVLTAILLGTENYKEHRTDLSPTINRLSSTVQKIFQESSTLSMIPAKFAQKLNLPVWKRFVNVTDSAIKTGNDMVEYLLKIANPNSGLLMEIKETGMKDDDIKRIVIDLILAAGDTTSYTTQWLLHMLSIHDEVQDEIFQETRRANEKEIINSSLLKGALRESLRLYPVAPFVTRYMPDNVLVDGYQINKGELVFMCLYSSGRNENSFLNPDSFLPERWTRDENGYKGVKNPSASMPFAMGSRSCIGKKIAEMQILTTISKILKNFRLTSQNKNKIGIKLQLIAVPEKPVQIILKKR